MILGKWKIPLLILLVVAWSRLMTFQISPLTSRDIVSYELAKTQAAATAIQNTWARSDLIGKFKLSIYLDYVFIVIYGLCLYVFGTTASRILFKARSRMAIITASLAVFVACLCDALENMGMLWTVSFESNNTVVLTTFWLAVIKFALVVAVLVYSMIGLITYLLYMIQKKLNPSKNE